LDEDTAGYKEHVDSPENGWDPIGTGGFDFDPFHGVFEGNGYEISDFTANRPSTTGVGLFASNDGTIEDTTVSQIEIVGDSEVGSLVGRNRGVIKNCAAIGNVTGNRAGVLIGWNTGQVADSTTEGTASGTRNVGGLAGQNNGEIMDCFAKADITGNEHVGGLVGQVFLAKYETVIIVLRTSTSTTKIELQLEGY